MSSIAASPPCATRIERVVVHRNGALVTRRGRLTGVGPGRHDVEVSGLPLLMNAATLRVRGHRCAVGLVEEVARAELVAAPATDEHALLEHKLRLAALDQRRAAVRTLMDAERAWTIELPPADVVSDGPGAEALLQLGALTDRRRRALVAELRSLDDQRRVLVRDESALIAAARATPTPPRIARGLRVQLDDIDEGAALEVEYFVAPARWVPSYTVQLTSAGKGARARLLLGAIVAQASGEDWDDVELAVSTVDLRRETTLPVLRSWRIGRAQPARPRGYRPLPDDLPTLFAAWDRFPSAPTTTTTTTTPTPTTTTTMAPPPPPPPVAMPPMPPMAAPPSLAAPVSRYSSAAAAALPAGGAAPAKRAMADVAPPERARVSIAAAPSAPSAPSAPEESEIDAGFGAGGGPEGAGGHADDAPLPAEWRATTLRMAGPDESDRGLLVPVRGLEHLAWLLSSHDVVDPDGDGRRDTVLPELARAVRALEAAAARLAERPLPPGTSRTSGTPRVFTALASASVPGDGADHRVEVHAEEAAATMLHVAVPREALDVHRACRLSPAGPLPAGPVQVYEDGGFVVASHIADTGGGGAVRLALGVDPDVRLQARTPHVDQGERGLMSSTSVVEHRVVVEARSSRREPVALSLYDRVPVVDGATKDVSVSDPWVKLNGAPSSAASRQRGPHDEPLAGGLRIDVTLQPDMPAIIEHGYAITLPAKLELVGGNRRE
jgi:hypothetical protein